jgi:hypothetical protein
VLTLFLRLLSSFALVLKGQALVQMCRSVVVSRLELVAVDAGLGLVRSLLILFKVKCNTPSGTSCFAKGAFASVFAIWDCTWTVSRYPCLSVEETLAASYL